MITASSKKIIILQGSPGSGKSSELHRLMHRLPQYHLVLSEPLPIQLGRLEPSDTLERLLNDIFELYGSMYTKMPANNLQARTKYILDQLVKANYPTLICMDNAEHIFDERGNLDTTWQHFLTIFAQTTHQAKLIIASQEWPGLFLVESQLIATVTVPRLSRDEGTQLLQALGVRDVSVELLGQVVDAVGGIPVCLEWIVKLMREPVLRDDWSDFEERDNEPVILERLLEDPVLFSGSVAKRVQPLLCKNLQ
jgi:hypothetical protein